MKTSLLKSGIITVIFIISSLTANAQYPVVAGTANSNANGNATSHVINLPSGVQVSDLLIVIMGCRDRTFTTTTVSFPSGWTELVTRTAGAGQGVVFYKVATATEAGAASITVSTGSVDPRSAYTVYRIQKGTYTGNPQATFINTTSMVASATNPNPPSLTPSWGSSKNLWIVGAAGYRAGTDPNINTFIPAGFSNGTYSFDGSNTTTSSGSVSTATQNFEGATLDPGVFALTATVHRAFTIAIQAAPINTISTGSITGAPFCVTAATGSSVSVPFTSIGTFTGNTYTAQLSSAAGSFASPTTIGTLGSNVNSGTISATIPANTPTGNNYRIRVLSNSPAVTGSDNGSNLTINLTANTITPNSAQNIATGVNGTTLTVTENTSAISRTWFYGTTSGGPYSTDTGISTTTYTPNFVVQGTYYIVCETTFSCGTAISNEVQVTASPTIATDAIVGSPFCVSATTAAAVSVSFVSSGSFTGNTYTAQLSNSAGSFASPISIGSILSDANSGIINATIPASSATGTGYRIRVISNGPPAIVTDNGSNLTINLATNNITPGTSQNIATGVNGTTLTVTENPTAISREWFYSTTPGGPYSTDTGISATTYIPNFAIQGTYYVVCETTFLCGTVTSNQVQVIVSPTITTAAIVGSSFCAGSVISVPFISSGTFLGNTYTAQLSSSTGSFASPINIGTLVSDANSGVINATISAATTPGTGYRIRVISNGPPAIVTDNGSNISINALPVNRTVGTALASICTDTGTNITVATSINGTSYQLRNNADNSLIGSSVNGAGGTINLPTGILTGTTTFNVLATITATGCTAQMTVTPTVTVNPVIANNTVSSVPAICSGVIPATLLGSTPTGGGGTYTYNWEQSTDNLTFGNATGTRTGINYSPPALTQSTWYRRTVTSGGCTDISVAIEITVNPLPAIVTVSGGGSVCNSTTLTAANSGDGTIYFQGTTSGGTSTATASSSQLVSTAGTYYFRALSASGCWGGQGSATVTIIASPTTTGANICEGGSGSLTVTTTCTPVSPTAATKDAGTGADNTAGTIGTGVWTSPGNITTAGTPYATQSTTSGVITHYLVGTNYGFAIPSDANIMGITMVINRQVASTTSMRDSSVKIVKNGLVTGTEKSNTIAWPNSFATATYGGTVDLWGTTWTTADINSSAFGVAIAGSHTSGSSRQIDVDYMRITVTYTIPGSLNWYTASSGGTIIGSGSPFNPVGVAGSGLTNTSTAGTTTFYAECSTVPGCRTATNFVINPALQNPVANEQMVCSDGLLSQTLTATATLTAAEIAAGATIIWWDSAGGGTQVSNPTQVGPGGVTYYAQAASASCSSGRTPVKLAILPKLEDVTACSEYTVPELFPYTYFKDELGNYWNAGDKITSTKTITPIGERSDYEVMECTPFTVTISSPSASIVQTNVNCFSGSNGSATVTATGGIVPYTYSWNDGANQTSATATGLVAGSYMVTITDAHGCETTASTMITEPAVVSVSNVAQSTIPCNGDSATVTITAGGGTGALSYTFDGVTNATGIFSHAAGTDLAYSVTDTNNCAAAIGTFTIVEPVVVSVSNVEQSTIACNGDSATVTITAAGGTGALLYTFDGVTNATGIFTHVAGTELVYSVTDANNCEAAIGTFTIVEPAVVSVSNIAQSSIACNGDSATVTITAAGGTGALSYTLDGVTNATGIFTHTAGTDLAFSVTDANTCSAAIGTFTIVEPVVVSVSNVAQSSIACNGGSATVTITAAGGTGALSYTLDGVTNATGIFTHAAGTDLAYSVTDANNCAAAIGTFTIVEPVVVSVSNVAQSSIACNGGSAIVTITAVGGTGALSYTFDGVTNATGIFTHDAGTDLAFSVTDANTCSAAIGTFTIVEPVVVSVSNVAQSSIACNGDSATVTITAAGGTGALLYTFDGVTNATGVFTHAAGTDLAYSVTDVNNCEAAIGTFTIVEPAVVSVSNIAQSTIACNGDSATVTITAAGGTGALSYTFDGVTNATGVFTHAAGTDFAYSVTDANNCATVTGTFTIAEPVVVSVSNVEQSTIACSGDSATVSITAAGGTGALSYTLDGVTNATGIFTHAAGTDLAYSVTDANNCAAAIGIFTIVEPVVVSVSNVEQSTIACNGDSATVTITATGGTGVLSYTFDGVTNATGIFNHIVGTDLVYSITDANNCTAASGSFTIVEPAVVSVSNVAQSSIACNGGSATVTITAAGGTGALSYTFDGVTNATGVFIHTAGADLAYTVTDVNNCASAIGIFTIAEPAVVSVSNVTQSTIACNGGLATVTITAAGGTGALLYTFDGVTNTTGIFTHTAGTDLVYSVTDADICTVATGIFSIVEPVVVSVSNVEQSTIACNGDSATVTITAAGGTGTLSYTLDGVTNATGIFTHAAGTDLAYSVTDTNNCAAAIGIFTIVEPVVVSVSSVAQSTIACNGGSATVTISAAGGTGVLSYTFDGVTNTTGIFTHAAGTDLAYSITDANTCTAASGTFTIVEPAVVSVSNVAQSSIACNGGSAIVTITAAGGTGTLSYTFDGVTNATGIFTHAVGTDLAYSVTDADICTVATGTFSIVEPILLEAEITAVTNVDCFGNKTGSATVIPSGGVTPYTYLWNDSAIQNTDTATGLLAGEYMVTVTDANLCTITKVVTITQPAILSVSGIPTNVSCYGLSNGSIAVSNSPGSTVVITNIANVVVLENNLPAGTYTLTATAAGGNDGQFCTTTASVIIGEPVEVTLTAIVTNVSCNGLPDGSISLTTNTGSTVVFSNLVAGNYSFSTTAPGNQGQDCTAPLTVEVKQPVKVTVSGVGTNVSCNGLSDGSIEVINSIGSTVVITNAENVDVTANNGTYGPGTYILTATAPNGNANGFCTASTSVTITQPAILSVSGVVTNVSCYGLSNGSIAINNSAGSTVVITNASNEIVSATGLPAGFYTLTATADGGNPSQTCTVTESIEIIQPAEVTLSAVITNVSCFGLSDGSIKITNNAGLSITNSGLFAGSYTYSTDGLGGNAGQTCSKTVTFVVEQPIEVTVSGVITNVSCFGADDGSIAVTSSLGSSVVITNVANADVTANNGSYGPGVYTLTAKAPNGNANGFCIATDEVTIIEPILVAVSATSSNVSCNGLADGTITVSDVSAGATTMIQKDGIGADLSAQTTFAPGTYLITATAQNGIENGNCSATKEVTITEPILVTVSATSTNASCNGLADATITVNDLSVGATIMIQKDGIGANLSDQTNFAAGTYLITATAPNGNENGYCTATTQVVIDEPSAVTVLAPANQTVTYGAAANYEAATTGSEPITYQWQENAGSGFINISNGGIYSGVTTATLGLSKPTVVMSGYKYHVIVSNSCAQNVTSGEATLTVNAKALVIGITADNKAYDGNATAVSHASIISGLVTGDLVTVATSNGMFNNANVGTAKPVTADVSKSGADSGNYIANITAATTANINAIALTVTADNIPVIQYSDLVPSFTAAITGFVNGETLINSGVTGSPSFTTNASLAVNRAVLSGPGSYNIIPSLGTLTSLNYSFGTYVNGALGVTKEDDPAQYTGVTSASIGTGNTVTIALSAIVTDIDDGHRGDIRNAQVRFKIQPYSCDISQTPQAIIYTPWINVLLVNSSDITVGTASENYLFDIGSCTTKDFDVTVEVENYYTGNSVPVRVRILRVLTNFGTVANGNETLCLPANPANITLSTPPSGGTGIFNYQWYYKNGVSDPNPIGTSVTGWTLIGSATNSSYDPPAGLTVSRTYAVQVDPTGSPDYGPATWASGSRKVTVTTNASPTVSDQPDQSECNTSTFRMTQSRPSRGTVGIWVLQSGNATITRPTSQTTTVTGVAVGTSATLRWKVTNGNCDAFDDVTVTNNLLAAVSDQPNQAKCNNPAFTMTQTVPVGGIGVWTLRSGNASINGASSPTALITLISGTSATVRWTVTSGTCSAFDDVIVTNNASPIVSNRPNLTQINNSTFTMTQTTPSVGTGIWTFVGAPGRARITNPTSGTTRVIRVDPGTTVTVRWTVTNGGCSAFDDVMLTNSSNAIKAAVTSSGTNSDVSTSLTKNTQSVDGQSATLFNVFAYPNPTNYRFNLVVEGNSNEKVNVVLYDVLGRMLKQIESIDNQPIQFGEELPKGEYIAIVSQGINKKIVRLIKR